MDGYTRILESLKKTRNVVRLIAYIHKDELPMGIRLTQNRVHALLDKFELRIKNAGNNADQRSVSELARLTPRLNLARGAPVETSPRRIFLRGSSPIAKPRPIGSIALNPCRVAASKKAV